MTTITLAAIEAAHQNVSAMIAEFKALAPRILTLPQAQIEIHQGERYAGIILGPNGQLSHHLILLPGAAEGVTWDEAKKFAAAAGGELPARSEQALLFTNLKSEFEDCGYWSSEQHAADADCAWFQTFLHGYQNGTSKSASLRARAVRRLIIS